MWSFLFFLSVLQELPIKKVYAKKRTQNLQKGTTQSTFNCSKLTIETVEQGVKYVQS